MKWQKERLEQISKMRTRMAWGGNRFERCHFQGGGPCFDRPGSQREDETMDKGQIRKILNTGRGPRCKETGALHFLARETDARGPKSMAI